MDKKIRVILIICASIIAFALVGFAVYYQINRGTGRLGLTVYPEDTTFSVGGKSYSGNQDIAIKGGTYTVVFNRELFLSTSKTITITGGKTTTIEVILETDEAAVEKLISSSGAVSDIVDAADQALGAETEEKFVADYPIVAILPLIEDSYRIDYALVDGVDEPTIEITLFDEALKTKTEQEIEAEALAKIESYGIDVSKIAWYTGSKVDYGE